MSAGAQFEQDFLSVFEDVFGWGVQVQEQDGPATLQEWDSLAQVRLVHELESRFGVRLPDEALLEAQTVGSLKEMVLAHAD